MGTWAAVRGAGVRRLAAAALAASLAAGVAPVPPALAQAPGAADAFAPPRPPADIPMAPPAASPPANVGPPTSLLPQAPPPASPPPAPAVQSAPPPPQAAMPPGQVALAVSARFGRDSPAINGGLLWRVYPDKPDPGGAFHLVKEERVATPTFNLPPGGYVVHVTFGLASAVKRVQLRAEPVHEVFDIAAGGARFEGRVGDSKIPPGQISFDVYPGSQFEPGDKRRVAQDVATGDVVLLPEGPYYVVSNYGDGNAVVRSDLRVQAGKLIDVTVNHRAAVITLKLVGEHGGEALANTSWTVLTPGGDVIKEAVGAFPRVILAEGDYVVIARNEGKVYNRNFKV
ncbi:MAG TPA: hypothetical protein VEK73_05100, partial [Xanthobacteraceae bacterium]|nr:hypothetical protein [Xanthobacteraceae bacterium]